jgi:hypothetical protein
VDATRSEFIGIRFMGPSFKWEDTALARRKHGFKSRRIHHGIISGIVSGLDIGVRLCYSTGLGKRQNSSGGSPMKRMLDATCSRCGSTVSITGLTEREALTVAEAHVCVDGVPTPVVLLSVRDVPGPGERLSDDERLYRV